MAASSLANKSNNWQIPLERIYVEHIICWSRMFSVKIYLWLDPYKIILRFSHSCPVQNKYHRHTYTHTKGAHPLSTSHKKKSYKNIHTLLMHHKNLIKIKKWWSAANPHHCRRHCFIITQFTLDPRASLSRAKRVGWSSFFAEKYVSTSRSLMLRAGRGLEPIKVTAWFSALVGNICVSDSVCA